jgi:hypothetical protein
VFKNEFRKILYLYSVNGKFGSFIIKADRFRGNRCKSMGICVNFSYFNYVFSELTFMCFNVKSFVLILKNAEKVEFIN